MKTGKKSPACISGNEDIALTSSFISPILHGNWE